MKGPRTVQNPGTNHYRRSRYRTGLGVLLSLGALMGASAKTARANAVEDKNIWFNLSMTGPLLGAEHGRSPWRFSFDSPNRFANNAKKYTVGEWRFGFGYILNPKWSVWTSYSYTHTDTPFTRVPYNEHRLNHFMTWTDRFGDFTLGFRNRLEERFPDSGNDMGLRSRHQLRVSHPIYAIKPLSWVVWDEIFFHLNDTDFGACTGVDQNRAFAGGSWKWSELARTELGYLQHFTHRTSGANRINHALAITLALTFR